MDSKPEESEAELLLAIACYGGSADKKEHRLAEDAFTALMERHAESLNSYVGKSVNKYETFLFDHGEMYSQLGEKIWRNAEKFDPQSHDREVIRAKFLAWASRIRENLFHDQVSAIHINIDYRDFEGILAILPEQTDDTSARSSAAALLTEALPTLNERDQDILRLLADSYPLDGRPLRTDSQELRALAESLNVTVPSLTTLRKRAIQRLQKAMAELEATK